MLPHAIEWRVRRIDQNRMKGALGAAIAQGLMIYLLVIGLAVSLPGARQSTLQTFGMVPVAPKLPPQMVARADRVKSGKSAPPNLKAQATRIVAPLPALKPSAVAAAPKPGLGSQVVQGAAPIAGPGSGAVGIGDGTGGGGAGDGTADGDGGSDATLISGRIQTSDYPRDALAAEQSGTVYLRFVVGVNGRVSDCAVTRSSGVPSLDDATCRLITKRFRYRPARDRAGNRVPQVIDGDHEWSAPKPPPAPDDDAG